MKNLRFGPKVRRYFWVLLFATYSVAAAGVVIDVLGDEYRQLSHVAVTTIASPEGERMAGASQIAAMYRAESGAPFSSLPPGSTFKVVWPDGSSEYVMVVSASSTSGIRPIPGSQRPASSAGAAGAAADVSADAAAEAAE